MSNPGRRAAVPNRGIPENILMFSQGFQPQLQNGLSRNFNQEGQFFPADQLQFPTMPGNFNFPVGFFPGQCPMPQIDVLNSPGSFPQHLFTGGRNFPVRQGSPMMLQNMVASSMFPPIGPNFMPWIGQNQNSWLNLNSPWIMNNIAQDMNLPWVTRMDPNQTGVFGARNVFPDMVTIDDEINPVPKTEFGHTTETQDFPDELLSSKQVCLKHQKRSSDEGTTTAITDGNKMDESTQGNEEAEAATEVTTVEKSPRKGKPHRSATKTAVSPNQVTKQNIVLIKSATSCNWKIKSGNALEANPGTSKTCSKSTEPAVAKSPPENGDAAADESLPLKKRKVSFWDRQPVPAKSTVSKKSMANEDITEAMKVTKAMAEGILRASQPDPKTLADGKLSQDVCILLTDICPKNDDGDDASSESSDHSSRYCSSLCTCRCLTGESG